MPFIKIYEVNGGNKGWNESEILTPERIWHLRNKQIPGRHRVGTSSGLRDDAVQLKMQALYENEVIVMTSHYVFWFVTIPAFDGYIILQICL